jgi:hypothetical protein
LEKNEEKRQKVRRDQDELEKGGDGTLSVFVLAILK